MLIHFDKTSSEVIYPIDSATVKRVLQQAVPRQILGRIAKVRFGCNRSTTQEARIVGRGTAYEIRVNFCLVNYRSKLLSDKSTWRRVIEEFGGVVDDEASEIVWSPDAARRYAVFLLMHEVGHAVYADQRGHRFLRDVSLSHAEEIWCDSFAREALERVGHML